ncbi:MAG: transcription initiation factor IIB [Promethearchaeota archaeon]
MIPINYSRVVARRSYPKESEMCPECTSLSLILDPQRGDIICSECGAVVDSHMMDPKPEWRSFSAQDYARRSRVGAPLSLTFHDKGLSTVIDCRDFDGMGKKLSPSSRNQAYKLRKWQTRMSIHSSKDRNLAFAMTELTRVSSQMNLTRFIQETAAKIYRKSVQMDLIKGRSIESMVIAALYTACRILNLPKTLDEFLNYTQVEKRYLSKSYRVIVQSLKLRIPTVIPTKFVPRFAQDLQISPESQYQAIKILKIAQKLGITSGKDPSSLAAASLYVATLLLGENKTQKEIAQVAHVTEVTVRNRYKELIKTLHLC